jgi:hypothetical protein
MEIEYPEMQGFGDRAKERIVTASVEDFAVDQLLYSQRYYPYYESRVKVGLENQPTEVCRAMGRLMDVLLSKALMTEEEFHDVIGTDYNLREKAKLKKDRAN